MNQPATPQADRERRALLRNIFICYFLSGAMGLVYQILWLRKLLLIFGSTVHAVSTVLTVFFGGLALGSWFFGRLIDRRERAGLRWYAALEAGVGLYAFATLPLFDAVQHVYLPIYRASDFSPTVLVGGAFLCTMLVLLLPATLLGGSFPVLSRFLVRSAGERGVKLANLYAINTAGAMTGTVLVYFFALPMLGLSRSLMCAGVLNLGIGMLCLMFDRHLEELGYYAAQPAGVLRGESPEAPERVLRWVLVAFGISGFSAMVYEVAWTRALSLVLGSSIYAFCVMLATFLGGMAFGSFMVRKELRHHEASLRQVVVLELGLALYGLASIAIFTRLPDWLVMLWPLTGGSFTGLTVIQIAISAAAMLVPTVLMGALFPLVSDMVTRRLSQFGRRLGTAYAINTLGGILGSFASGFILIPWLGLPWAIAAAAIMNCAAAVLVFLRDEQIRIAGVLRLAAAGSVLAVFILLSGFVAVPSWQRQVFTAGAYLNPDVYRQISVRQAADRSELLFYRDDLNATVSVHRLGENIFLKVGGKTDASNGLDMNTQVMSAHIPLLLHPDPKRVLVIGLGSGVTLGEAGRHPVTALHCAEINQAVIEGARYFADINHHVHDDPRTRIFPVDGRNFLLASQAQYDVIISEPSNPWMAGLAYLFTQEFYQLAKRRLAPGGIMCQWLQIYRLFPGDVKLMLRTFHHEFPHMTVWSTLQGDMLLIGSMEPHQVPFKTLAERMARPALQPGLRRVQIDRPELFLQMVLLGDREIDQLTADTPWLHQDDQPSVEFNAPKALYSDSTLAINYEGLRAFRADGRTISPDAPSIDEDAAMLERVGRFWDTRGDDEDAQKALEQAVRVRPEAAGAWTLLGEVRIKRRQLLKGEEALRRAAELAPKDWRCLHLLAVLQLRQGRKEQARAALERVGALVVPDAGLAEEIGKAWQELEQPALAAEYNRSALSQRDTPSVRLLLDYGKVLSTLKEWDTLEHVCRLGAARFPFAVEFHLMKGTMLLERGRWAEAESAFKSAIALVPQQVEAYYGLGQVALSAGRASDAQRWLRRGLWYDPYHKESLSLLDHMRVR